METVTEESYNFDYLPRIRPLHIADHRKKKLANNSEVSITSIFIDILKNGVKDKADLTNKIYERVTELKLIVNSKGHKIDKEHIRIQMYKMLVDLREDKKKKWGYWDVVETPQQLKIVPKYIYR